MPTRAHWFGLAAALMLAGVPCRAAETSITAIVGATVIHPDRDLPSAEMLPERVVKAMSHPTPPKPSAIALQNLRKVWDAGIPVVMGTDAGNIGTLHGPSVFREMEIMTQAGLTPLQVLRSATSNGAKAMGMERAIGTLAPGKLADLVILDADPLADVMNLSRIHRVIRDGKLFAPDELIRSIGN